jgi:ribonuclease E
MKKEMLINVLQPEECRIAIMEDGVLEELYVERTSHESYVGNIYKGRIVNIEPSIQAAFVDFGVGRNGFLHVSDVEPAYYRHLESRQSDRGGPRGRGRDRHRGPARRSRAEPQEEFFEFDLERETGGEVASTPPRPPSVISDETPMSRGSRRNDREEPDLPPVSEEMTWMETEPESPRPGADRPERTALPEQPADSPKNPELPRYMDSAERRTEEENPGSGSAEPGSGVDDADLFFPKSDAPLASESSPERFEETRSETEFEEPGDAWAETFPSHSSEDAREEPEAVAPASESRAEASVMERDEEQRDFRPRRRPQRDDRSGGRRGGRRGPGRPGAGRPKPLIQDIFRRGQEVLVQVIKEGIGTKGPTLSTYISIAGRYLVLMPGLNRIGVSRKIDDEEQRRRLREVLSELQPPKGLGFIIRTAGMDKNKKELQRDLAYLSRLWQVVVRRIRKIKAPAEIYQESDMITRTIRDTFTSEIDTIWVDEQAAFEHAQEFLQIVMPRYANRIRHYNLPEPLFHKYGIENEIARIQQRHVPLPNGGSIVIDQTEALVAIDVNSGNFRADNNAEETAYQMNLLAAKEIARQLRLRDLGGVIVNDFIDMREEKHRRGVERALREAVKRDRARTKILKISAFGLIEMTRQRIRPSLKRSVYQDCPHCLGMGQVKTCESMSIDVMRMLQLAAHHQNVHRIQVNVAEDVAHYLLNKKRKEISKLEESGEIQVTISASAGAPPEMLEFTCFDNNNNEVKFFPQPEANPRKRP